MVTAAGRAGRIGTELDCPLCDRAEPPAGLVLVRTAGPFDEETLPTALRHAHRVASGRWGCLKVLEVSADFSMESDPPIERRLHAGETQPIPPAVTHEVLLTGAVQLVVEFWAR